MEEKFDPRDYKSHAELPPEHKERFEAIKEGEGFVLKNVEKNSEVAYRLAVLEDRIINELRQEIEINNLGDTEQLISKYKDIEEARGYYVPPSEKDVWIEFFRQVTDYNVIRGIPADKGWMGAFQSLNGKDFYSQKTQNLLIEGVEPEDIEVMTRLLKDERFSLKAQLLEKIDDDDLLKKLYQLSKDDPIIAALIIGKVKNIETRVEMLGEGADSYGFQSMSEEARKYLLGDIWRNTVEVIHSQKEYDFILSLIDRRILKIKDLYNVLPNIESDQFLYDLVCRSKDIKTVKKLFQFIADKSFFSKIIEDNGQSLNELSEQEKQETVELAKCFLSALSQDPEIYQTHELHSSSCKFIVGFREEGEEGRIVIGFGVSTSDFHPDIFNELKRQSKAPSEDLCGGGYIRCHQEGGNKYRVVIEECSGSYGYYSNRVLELFRTQLMDKVYAPIADFERKEAEIDDLEIGFEIKISR